MSNLKRSLAIAGMMLGILAFAAAAQMTAGCGGGGGSNPTGDDLIDNGGGDGGDGGGGDDPTPSVQKYFFLTKVSESLYDEEDNLLGSGDLVTFTYDAAARTVQGTLAAFGGTYEIVVTYDEENRFSSMTVDGELISMFEYDDEGRISVLGVAYDHDGGRYLGCSLSYVDDENDGGLRISSGGSTDAPVKVIVDHECVSAQEERRAFLDGDGRLVRLEEDGDVGEGECALRTWSFSYGDDGNVSEITVACTDPVAEEHVSVADGTMPELLFGAFDPSAAQSEVERDADGNIVRIVATVNFGGHNHWRIERTFEYEELETNPGDVHPFSPWSLWEQGPPRYFRVDLYFPDYFAVGAVTDIDDSEDRIGK